MFAQENEKSFYLAGFIAADGSLQKRKYSKILKITLSSKDKEHLNKLKAIINSDHPIKEYDVKPSKLVKKYHRASEIQIVSNQMFDDLAKFNIIPNKTKIYELNLFLLFSRLLDFALIFRGKTVFCCCLLLLSRLIIRIA